MIMNENKYKILQTKTYKKQDELLEYLKTLNKQYLIHGISSLTKGIPYNRYIFHKRLENKEIINVFKTEEMKKKHKKLQDIFDMINYPGPSGKMNLILYGKLEKEIKEAIENYMVKELYCNIDILKKFRKVISSEYINFPIIEINKISQATPGLAHTCLENDKRSGYDEAYDIGDYLLKNYNGIIGILYY